MYDLNDLPKGLKITSVCGEYATYAVDEDGAMRVCNFDLIKEGLLPSEVKAWAYEMAAAVDILTGGAA